MEEIEKRMSAFVDELEKISPGPRPAGHPFRLVWLIPAAAAAAIAFAGIDLAWRNRAPKDTFTSPEEAYACVQQAFGSFSSSIWRGEESVEASVRVFDLCRSIMEK